MIGHSAQLIAGTDTIVWSAERQENSYRMYSSDTRWSIFNVENWETEDWKSSKEHKLPDMYDHTFIITTADIERSKP